MQLPFSCEKSGAIALVLPDLMTGWHAGCLAGRQADQIVLNLEIFKILRIPDEIFNFLLCLTKVQCYCTHTNAF